MKTFCFPFHYEDKTRETIDSQFIVDSNVAQGDVGVSIVLLDRFASKQKRKLICSNFRF